MVCFAIAGGGSVKTDQMTDYFDSLLLSLVDWFVFEDFLSLFKSRQDSFI